VDPAQRGDARLRRIVDGRAIAHAGDRERRERGGTTCRVERGAHGDGPRGFCAAVGPEVARWHHARGRSRLQSALSCPGVREAHPEARMLLKRMLATWAFAMTSHHAATAAPPVTDEVRACLRAYEDGQTSRDEHKLVAARAQLIACSRDACPAGLRRDCV